MTESPNYRNTLVIIPAFNEEQTLGAVIDDLRNHGLENSLVVDDGSTDQTAQIARDKGVKLISHALNRGLGAGLGTGFEYARQLKPLPDAIVTFDADGQHQAADALNVVQPILKQKVDVVIGTRQHQLGQIPLARLAGNWVLDLVTFLFFGIWTTDSQSGLRAFSLHALRKISLKSNRMEVSSEIFGQIRKHGLKLAQAPIPSVYTKYSLAKGQDGLGTLNGIKIISRLILRSVGH